MANTPQLPLPVELIWEILSLAAHDLAGDETLTSTAPELASGSPFLDRRAHV